MGSCQACGVVIGFNFRVLEPTRHSARRRSAARAGRGRRGRRGRAGSCPAPPSPAPRRAPPPRRRSPANPPSPPHPGTPPASKIGNAAVGWALHGAGQMTAAWLLAGRCIQGAGHAPPRWHRQSKAARHCEALDTSCRQAGAHSGADCSPTADMPACHAGSKLCQTSWPWNPRKTPESPGKTPQMKRRSATHPEALCSMAAGARHGGGLQARQRRADLHGGVLHVLVHPRRGGAHVVQHVAREPAGAAPNLYESMEWPPGLIKVRSMHHQKRRKGHRAPPQRHATTCLPHEQLHGARAGPRKCAAARRRRPPPPAVRAGPGQSWPPRARCTA